MSIKRLLLDATEIVQKRNGTAQWVINLVKNISDRSPDRYEITVILNEDTSEELFFSYFEKLDCKVHIYFEKAKPIGPGRDLKFRRILKKEKNNFDLFICPTEKWPYWAMGGLLILHDARALDPSFLGLGPLKRMYLKRILTKGISNATKIVVVSRTSQYEFERHLGITMGEKVHIVYGPTKMTTEFELQDIRPQISNFSNLKFFLYYGQLWRPHKNVPAIRKAFTKFVTSINDDIHFVYAGDDRNTFDWSQCELEHYIGYISEAEKSFLLEKCSAYVHLSLFEGFGLPIIEAMTFNKPVLCSDIPVFRELHGNSVMYADPYDIDLMVCGFGELVKSLNKSRNYDISKFSWEAFNQRITQVIDEAS